MDKLESARLLLEKIKMPAKQQGDLCCLTLLAMAKLRKRTPCTKTGNVTAGKIFVTAFLDFTTFKKFSGQLAWETEVWIADMPNHMIHLNGDKFLGPR